MTKNSILPPQHTGTHTGVSKNVRAVTRHQAIILFNSAKQRLLDINHWDKLCGTGSAVFQLTDASGKELNNTAPRVGDLVRISLPGPGNPEGDGYDWVRIEEFENKLNQLKDEEIFGFRVRPTANPRGLEKESAHFYTKTASSTFLIVRVADKVTVMEKGRNEKTNTESGSLITRLRNAAVAVGARLGLARPQWKMLIKGVLFGPPE